MSISTQVIIFSLAGGLFSLIGGALLLASKKTAIHLATYATPFAAGAMIAAVFLDLISEGVAEADPQTVLLWVVVGIILFYFMERFLHWFHHHHRDDESKAVQNAHDTTLPLIIVGDTIHNALDGVAIAAAFLVNPTTGIITTLVIAAHEIPQEIGDFGLMLHKGLSRAKTLLVNALSAVATTVFAVVTYLVGSAEALPMGVLVGVSAGFLLYIAMSDIMPELHKHAKHDRFLGWQPLLLVAGAAVVSVTIHVAHTILEH